MLFTIFSWLIHAIFAIIVRQGRYRKMKTKDGAIYMQSRDALKDGEKDVWAECSEAFQVIIDNMRAQTEEQQQKLQKTIDMFKERQRELQEEMDK
ncbi:hypothetical protein DFP96_101670 [Listeria rocourtiae]|uniref:Uncharacterized protein n=2 Tax=Listeria rocourtiae TaxID=647910 RepID=A0A4R6ZSM6_9LIST|nr:hypothetical protein DFP96_101670 [Listeria rocourtiae]